MSQENNSVLSAVVLMERVMPRLNASSRETISRKALSNIQQSLTMVLRSLTTDCTDPKVLTPIMEAVTLIDTVLSSETFIETDDETKNIVVDKLSQALSELYLFAGKFYMKHDFTWSLTKTDILRHIVDACIDRGFYFGVDEQLRAEGLI